MTDINKLLSEAEAAMQRGERTLAIDKFVSVYRRAYGNGRAKVALTRIAKDLFTESIAVRNKGDIDAAIALGIRSLELNPDSGEVRAETDRLLGIYATGRDMTKECLIFPDTARATRFYSEAIQTALDFAVYGGVTGDILEFGVLAGWTARLFAERMREIQFFGDLYLFDSFAGLPRNKDAIDVQSYDVMRGVWEQEMELPKSIIDEIGMPIDQHIAAKLSQVISRKRIHVKKGFFSESLREPLKTKAAIVHLDCDLYQSTIEVLDALHEYEVLQDGTVLMFDDWNCNRANPHFGQRRALKEFLTKNKARYDVSQFFSYGFNCNAFILHDLDVRPDTVVSTQ